MRLPEPRIEARARERLAGAVGAAQVRDDRLARVEHAAGKGYADLVRLRAGDAAPAPDLVLLPGSAGALAAALAVCAEARLAVVPFGGGTSVVGGVEPLGDGFAGVVSLGLRGLDGVAVDRVSGTARLAAGLLGPEAERRLASEGVTLGHTPQSFEFSTVGGWVATRSAGQASTGYGRIDELVEGVRLVAPAGELTAAAFPASAAGPDLRELVVGSEGVLGVISEATLRVRPVPALRHYEGWSFRSFAAGCAAFRALSRAMRHPTWPGSPTRRRRGCRSRWRRAEARSSAPGAATCACAATRAAASRSSASRATPTTSSAASRARPICCAPAGGCASGAARARPGGAGASPGPTCVTSCSTAG